MQKVISCTCRHYHKRQYFDLVKITDKERTSEALTEREVSGVIYVVGHQMQHEVR